MRFADRLPLAVLVIVLFVAIQSRLSVADEVPRELRGDAADGLLAMQLGRPGNYRLDSTTEEKFQFEYRFLMKKGLGSDAQTQWARAICESDGKRTAMLLLTHQGRPYAYIGQGDLYIVDSRNPRSLLLVDRIRAAAICGRYGGRVALTLDSELPRSQYMLNASRLIHSFLASEHTNEYLPFRQAFEMRIEPPASVRVLLSREAWQHSFPVRCITCVSSKKGVQWEITNIQCGPGISRSILNVESVFEREFPGARRRLEKEDELAVAWGAPEFTNLQEQFDSPNAIATGDELGALCLPKMGGDPALRKLAATQIEQIDAELAKREGDHSKAIFELLDQLHGSTLFDAIVTKSILIRGQESFAVSGRDPNRTVICTEALLGPDLQRHLYNTLADVVCQPRMNKATRARALDLLGDIRLPDDDPALIRIAKCIAADESFTLKVLLASVRARQLDATSEDITLLRKAFRAVDTKDELRGVCLEALLLADATSGFTAECEKLLANDAVNQELKNRCQMAVACSKEGRDILISGLTATDNRRLSPGFVLPVLGTRIAKNDRQWPALLEALEQTALDKSLSYAEQVTAARMAATDDGERPFREKFLRHAIADGNKVLIESALLYCLSGMKQPLDYIPEIMPLLESPDPSVRVSTVRVVTLYTKDTIPREHYATLEKFVSAIDATNDVELQRFGKIIRDQLTAQQRAANLPLP